MKFARHLSLSEQHEIIHQEALATFLEPFDVHRLRSLLLRAKEQGVAYLRVHFRGKEANLRLGNFGTEWIRNASAEMIEGALDEPVILTER